MSFRKTIFAAIASAGLTFSTSAAAQQSQGPFYDLQHPPNVVNTGGQPVTRVDCSTMVDWNGKRWITGEFARQADSNNQISTKIDPLKYIRMPDKDAAFEQIQRDFPQVNYQSYEQAINNLFSRVLIDAFNHQRTAHKRCVVEANGLDAQIGLPPPDKFKNYQNGSLDGCELKIAIQQCNILLGPVRN